MTEQFLLFCMGSMGLGVAMGIADIITTLLLTACRAVAAKSHFLRARWGLAAAVMGPEIARRTVDVVPGIMYAGCFLQLLLCSFFPSHSGGHPD